MQGSVELFGALSTCSSLTVPVHSEDAVENHELPHNPLINVLFPELGLPRSEIFGFWFRMSFILSMQSTDTFESCSSCASLFKWGNNCSLYPFDLISSTNALSRDLFSLDLLR